MSNNLRDVIVSILKTNPLTLDQLMPHVQMDYKHHAQIPPNAHTVDMALRKLHRDGVLVREATTHTAGGAGYRYWVPEPRYRFQDMNNTIYNSTQLCCWSVVCGERYINNMTEAEARACVTALNDLDRKARATQLKLKKGSRK